MCLCVHLCVFVCVYMCCLPVAFNEEVHTSIGIILYGISLSHPSLITRKVLYQLVATND